MKEGTNPPKRYSIGEFAKMTGVTERTLRYYDKQGLLAPSFRNEHGRRYYTDEDLFPLQKIMTMKFLDFSLDDISAYLQQPEQNLQDTLLVQYELLKQKQQQINRVLETIERMRLIAEGAGQIDNDLLLFLIHNLVNEHSQKAFLSQQLPSSFVQAIFLEGYSFEEKIELEQRLTAKFIELKECCNQGKRADDEQVLAIAAQLKGILQDIVGPAVQQLNEEELKTIEQLEESELPLPLFPTGMSMEEETFMKDVFSILSERDEAEVACHEE